MDYFGGFKILQSLAGGTGSGLGTHLAERLRDDYPRANMINVAVWPYMTGEVVLQNYNLLLTLNGLMTHSNAVVTVFNDEILTTCRELLKSPQPSYSLMNKVIAQQMTSIFYPVADSQKSRVGLW
jgi:tubulin delta